MTLKMVTPKGIFISEVEQQGKNPGTGSGKPANLSVRSFGLGSEPVKDIGRRADVRTARQIVDLQLRPSICSIA